MQLSKIGSVNTYTKCLKQLHDWSYIIYHPSYNPHVGSQVTLISFDKGSDKADEQEEVKLVRPYINYRNIRNNDKHISKQPVSDAIKVEDSSGKTLIQDSADSHQKKDELQERNPDSYREKKFYPPEEQQVTEYFQQQNQPQLEALKFFNYFKSVGWKVGKSKPMKDWKAAAKNWILNTNNKTYYTKTNTRSNHLHTNQNKNYDEPL